MDILQRQHSSDQPASRLVWLVSGMLFLFAGIAGLSLEGNSLVVSSLDSPQALEILPQSAARIAIAEDRDWISSPCVAEGDLLEHPMIQQEQANSDQRFSVGEISPEPSAEECVFVEEGLPAEVEAPTESASNKEGRGNTPSQSLRYTIQPGDSLWSISKRFGLDPGTLADANLLQQDRYLKPGQILQIPPGPGVYHRIQPGETLWTICQRYSVDLESALTENAIEDPQKLQVGSRIFLPGARPRREITDMVWPVKGRLTSGFGYRQHPMGGQRKFHRGIDIAAPRGREIRAAQNGEVVSAGRRGSYGLAVILKHDKTYSTLYGHCSVLSVKVGQRVEQGETIARIGSSGVSTGPHLHFEIRQAGRAVDPRPFLP